MNTNKNKIERLLASPISILFIGVLIVAVTLIWFIPTKDSLREGISNVEKSTVKLAVVQIEGFLGTIEEEVKISASLMKQDLGDKENDLVIKKLMRSEYIINATLSDKDGNEIVKYNKYKTMLANEMGSISSVVSFKEAIATKMVSWSDVLFSLGTEPTINVYVPIFSPRKDLVGVLSAEFKINSIFSTISKIGNNKDAQAYIVNRDGVLVSGKDLSLVLKNTNYFTRKIVRDSIRAKAEIVVFSDNDEYVYVNEEGVEVFSVGALVPRTKWAVVFEESKDKAISNITILSIFALLSALLFVLLTIFMRAIYLKTFIAREELQKSLIEQRIIFEESVRLRRISEDVSRKLQENDKKLVEKIEELENFQKFAVDRELRMVELKEEIAALKMKLGTT